MRRSTRTLSGVKEGTFDDLEAATLSVGSTCYLPASTFIGGTIYSSGGVGGSGRQLTGDSTLGDSHSDTITVNGKLEGYTDHLIINDNVTIEGSAHNTIIEGNSTLNGTLNVSGLTTLGSLHTNKVEISSVAGLKLLQDDGNTWTTINDSPSTSATLTYLRGDGQWITLLGSDNKLRIDYLPTISSVPGGLRVGPSSGTNYQDNLLVTRGSIKIGNSNYTLANVAPDGGDHNLPFNMVLNAATNFRMYNTWDSSFEHGGSSHTPGGSGLVFNVDGASGNTNIAGTLDVAGAIVSTATGTRLKGLTITNSVLHIYCVVGKY